MTVTQIIGKGWSKDDNEIGSKYMVYSMWKDQEQYSVMKMGIIMSLIDKFYNF